MLSDLIKKLLQEASSESGGSGAYITPLQPGLRKFDKTQLKPFDQSVSDFDSPLLQYDSYDGKMETRLDQIKKIESQAKKITDKIKKNPSSTFSDDDGGNINPTPGKNLSLVPIKEWIEINENTISEDLAVWFGTKKKPKGSKQPKGPWVNICRKKEGGGHPPCGRPEADSKGYPKCRAAGVASKMSDEQKKAACGQKRRAEKNNPKIGTGNSPTMTSYKPRKQNESLRRLIKKILNEGQSDPIDPLTLKCIIPKTLDKSGSYREIKELTFQKFFPPQGQTPGKLFLNKPNPSGVVPNSYQREDENTMLLSFVKIGNEKILGELGIPITGDGVFLLHYVEGNQKYFCTTTEKISMDWESFFDEENVTHNFKLPS